MAKMLNDYSLKYKCHVASFNRINILYSQLLDIGNVSLSLLCFLRDCLPLESNLVYSDSW